mgnify:CR=1 FL=1
MTLILLHKPVPATPADADPALAQRRFERVHMFPGRALGEDEFDREQEYADLRLASLLDRKRQLNRSVLAPSVATAADFEELYRGTVVD